MTNTLTQAAIEAATFQLCPVACKVYCATCVRKATAAIEAYRAAMREAGVVEVPEVPTDAMISAGIAERHEAGVPEAWSLATANIYAAMIAAAEEGE